MQLACRDEVPDRVDDEGREHRLGERREQRREDEQGDHDGAPRDQERHRRPGPATIVDRRAGHAAGGDHAAHDAGRDVDSGMGAQFLVGIDTIAVTLGELPGDPEGLAVGDEEDPDCRDEELSPADGRRPRKRQPGQAE